jgi:hypothetical protein
MRRLLLGIVVIWVLPSAAQAPKGYYFPEQAEEKPWEEQKLLLPPYPKQENLIKFDVSGSTSFEFFVDLTSVSVGNDGVIRYTLIARSPTGVTNVSFEGIKCAGRERKLYAFGRPDGSWVQARNAQWGPVTGLQANRQHAALADDYFCPGRLIVRDTDEALHALKRGGHPRASN